MQPFQIFVIEDDEWYGELIEYHLSLNPDYNITRFTNGKDALAALHRNPDLITVDFSLPDYKGDKLIEKIREYKSNIPFIVISSQEDVGTAVKILKMGVSDYIVKDENTVDLLWNAVSKIKETTDLKKEVEQLRSELSSRHAFNSLLKGQSEAMTRTFSLMEKAAKTNINVSITGETGTGKELAAKAIHFNSNRKNKPFVEVNMAAIPRELLESELMGHEKGSFTGAIGRKIGKFEEANGGTVFLDEIAELDINLQSKILRVLQEREIVRVGGSERVKLDIRLIVATHKNLLHEVQAGRFREDLYFRIYGLPVEMPPLRERGNDILILARYFLDQFVKENDLSKLEFSRSAKEKLLHYEFPGNVRELKAMIDLSAIMCNGNEVRAEDLSITERHRGRDFSALDKTLKEHSCDIIAHYLKRHNNNVPLVARKLDIGRSTIYKMIQLKEVVVA